ncbi:MAG: hypothetical protein ACRCVL_04635, partial [Cetobacterium sp.]
SHIHGLLNLPNVLRSQKVSRGMDGMQQHEMIKLDFLWCVLYVVIDTGGEGHELCQNKEISKTKPLYLEINPLT